MKPFNLLSTFCALGLATTVTAGTMYVTAKAAVQQEQENLSDSFSSDEKSPATETPSETVPSVPVVVDSVPVLAPEDIISDADTKIVLDAAGGFRGRLSMLSTADSVPAGSYTVKIVQHGAEVAVTKTDAEGRFSVSGLSPGVSGIIAISDSGLIVVGAHLVQSEPGKPASGEVGLSLDSSVVAGSDVVVARELIGSALSLGDMRFSGALSEEDKAFKFGSGEKATSLVSQQVQLDDDGKLVGSVSLMDERTGRLREVLDMRVYFLRDGKVVASTDVRPDGRFSVAGLNPGIHSVVGAGKDGAFAFGVDIVGSSYEPEKPGDATPVSLRMQSGLSATAVGSANLNSGDADSVTDGTIQPPNAISEAIAPNAAPGAGGGAPGTGGGGSMGGGGGGIGGGGGLGGLLGAAAGGALGYALGRDNKDASPGN